MPSRASLRTRPLIQRILIRSWEYIPPVRVTLLAIRMLVVMWRFFLATLLVSAGNIWAQARDYSLTWPLPRVASPRVV